ncbi:hypothetical protein CASFOL_028849 [Castilleja foliolosa]|uniref:Pentatricopeptide repeat-containing protein n=1 Tax=Castilleja foliolosa TaxID=1961234 RepID=A0ABD3CCE5_9LAMI
MFLGLHSSKSRYLFVRALHIGPKLASPGAEDILFKALCVNIRQKKWKILNQLSSNLTNTLLSRIFREFQASPGLLLEIYQRIGEHKAISHSLNSCCITIHIMVGRKKYDDALSLMEQLMISKGHAAFEIFEALINTGSVSNIPVFDTLVRACTRNGLTDDAYELIKRLRIDSCWVSIHAMNNFLNHLLKIGDIGRFWIAYREMIFFGYYENVNTFNLLILALCKECKLSEAFSVLYKMLKSGIIPNVVGVNMLVDGACRADKLDLAVKLIEKIGIMSMGYKGNPELAEEIMGKMVIMGMSPNIRTYGILVDGYSRNGFLEDAFRLCDEMVEKGLIPNSAVYNLLIHWLYMEGDVSGALFLLSNMMKNCVPPDRFTHSIIVKGLCRNGQVNEALRVHNWGLEKNLAKDVFSHNVLIDYIFRDKDIRGAKQVLCSMFVRGLVPDVVTYGTMIVGYCKASGIEKALDIYSEMIKMNKNPNLVILNSILDGFCKEDNFDYSGVLIGEMKRLNMYDAVTFNTLLSGYCCSGKIEEAFGLFNSMGKMANKVTFNIMINMLCKLGLFEHAKELLGVMLCRGLKPDEITYTTLITSVSKTSSSEEVVKMHDYLVLRGVIPDEQTFKAVVSWVTEEGI